MKRVSRSKDGDLAGGDGDESESRKLRGYRKMRVRIDREDSKESRWIWTKVDESVG